MMKGHKNMWPSKRTGLLFLSVPKMQVLFITNTKTFLIKKYIFFFSQALLLRPILVGNLLMEAMLNQLSWSLEKTKSNICHWVPISTEKSKHSLLPTPISLRTYLDLWPRVWKLSLRYILFSLVHILIS